MGYRDLHNSFNPQGLNFPICQIKVQSYLKLYDIKQKERVRNRTIPSHYLSSQEDGGFSFHHIYGYKHQHRST